MAVFTYMHTICVSSPNPSSVAVFFLFAVFLTLSLELITAFDWTRTWNQLVLLLFCCDTSTFWWLFFPTSPLTAFGRANDFDIVICINSCRCDWNVSFISLLFCFLVVFLLFFGCVLKVKQSKKLMFINTSNQILSVSVAHQFYI